MELDATDVYALKMSDCDGNTFKRKLIIGRARYRELRTSHPEKQEKTPTKDAANQQGKPPPNALGQKTPPLDTRRRRRGVIVFTIAKTARTETTDVGNYDS